MSKKLAQPEGTRWNANYCIINGRRIDYDDIEHVSYSCEYCREMRMRPGRPGEGRYEIHLNDLTIERSVTVPSRIAKAYEQDVPPEAQEVVEEFADYIRQINKRIAPRMVAKLKGRLRSEGSIAIAGFTLGRDAMCAYKGKTYPTDTMTCEESNGTLIVRARGHMRALAKLSMAEDNACFLAEMVEYSSRVR